MLNKNLLTLTFVLLSLALISACQAAPPPFECKDELGCVTIKPDEPIKLGVLQT